MWLTSPMREYLCGILIPNTTGAEFLRKMSGGLALSMGPSMEPPVFMTALHSRIVHAYCEIILRVFFGVISRKISHTTPTHTMNLVFLQDFIAVFEKRLIWIQSERKLPISKLLQLDINKTNEHDFQTHNCLNNNYYYNLYHYFILSYYMFRIIFNYP